MPRFDPGTGRAAAPASPNAVMHYRTRYSSCDATVMAARLAWVIGLILLMPTGLVAADYPHHLEQQRLIIVGTEGEREAIRVRVAEAPADRRRGMQHLDPATVRANPMWFVFPDERPRTRWHMRNVAVAIDIAYVDANGRVLAVERMEPEQTGYGIEAPIQYALEVAAGQAETLGLEAGARIRTPDGERPR